MGGKVLELPEITAYHLGIDKGIEQGIEQGLAKGEAERKELSDEVARLKKELEELKKKA
ncbi:MAG: hypothetical protein J6U37_02785 [Lachnospiraceae bacterium]|nr:hypothetical protein [Lachnospiraceae bacterium]